MNAAAEFKAAFPEPHVVLGVRLLPLSLGRYRLLKRFNSPFVSEEDIAPDSITIIQDLFFALLVCGLRCQELKSLIEHKKLERECQRWGKHLRKIIRREEHFNVFAKVKQFQKFIEQETAMPWKIVPRSGDSGGSVSHWSHSMEVTLRSKVGWTAHEIEEEPMSKAMVDFFKFLESEGAVALITHEAAEELSKSAESNAEAFARHFAAENN